MPAIYVREIQMSGKELVVFGLFLDLFGVGIIAANAFHTKEQAVKLAVSPIPGGTPEATYKTNPIAQHIYKSGWWVAGGLAMIAVGYGCQIFGQYIP